MAGSDKYKLPTDYKLGAVAEKVALNLHLRLNEEDNDGLITVMSRFAYVPINMMQFILDRRDVTNSLVLSGELESKALLHYTGGMTKAGNACESLYVNNSKRVIGVTFGVPEKDLGSLLVLDIAGSVALQELSGVKEVYGGSAVVYDQRLPKPGPLKGRHNLLIFQKSMKQSISY